MKADVQITPISESSFCYDCGGVCGLMLRIWVQSLFTYKELWHLTPAAFVPNTDAENSLEWTAWSPSAFPWSREPSQSPASSACHVIIKELLPLGFFIFHKHVVFHVIMEVGQFPDLASTLGGDLQSYKRSLNSPFAVQLLLGWTKLIEIHVCFDWARTK